LRDQSQLRRILFSERRFNRPTPRCHGPSTPVWLHATYIGIQEREMNPTLLQLSWNRSFRPREVGEGMKLGLGLVTAREIQEQTLRGRQVKMQQNWRELPPPAVDARLAPKNASSDAEACTSNRPLNLVPPLRDDLAHRSLDRAESAVVHSTIRAVRPTRDTRETPHDTFTDRSGATRQRSTCRPTSATTDRYIAKLAPCCDPTILSERASVCRP
jgi:hypothetical protein